MIDIIVQEKYKNHRSMLYAYVGDEKTKIYDGDFNFLKYHGNGTIYIENKKFIEGTFNNGKMDMIKVYLSDKLIIDGIFNKDKIFGYSYIYKIDGSNEFYKIIDN